MTTARFQPIVIAAIVMAVIAVAAGALVLTGDDDGGPDPPSGKEVILGQADPRAVRVRVRYLTPGGCIGHRRSARLAPSGSYEVELPRGAKPLTLEDVGRQGRVLERRRLGPEVPQGPTPRAAAVTCGRPFMGVACRSPGSVACDRVAVYVSSSLFAESVRVTIAGRRLELPRKTGLGPDGRGTFEGFLQPAGLRNGRLRVRTAPGTARWIGEPPVSAPMRVDVRFRGGRRASRTFRVRLSPGYG
jgi:hypothetical protein